MNNKPSTKSRNVRHHPSNNSGYVGKPNPNKPRISPQDRSVSPEGVYLNGRLTHATTSLIGSLIQVVVKEGTVYEGILKTFSPNYEIVVETAIEIDPKKPANNSSMGSLLESLRDKKQISDTLIFELKNVVMLKFANVDMESANRGFTDADINKKSYSAMSPPRELVVFNDFNEGETIGLEDTTGSRTGGWKAEDMFHYNKVNLKVQSNPSGDITESSMYTHPLPEQKNTKEYREMVLQAEKMANSIEGSSKRNDYDKQGDERTEEDQFSAVTRPIDGPWRDVKSKGKDYRDKQYPKSNTQSRPPHNPQNSRTNDTRKASGSISPLKTGNKTQTPVVSLNSDHINSKPSGKPIEDLKQFGSNFKLSDSNVDEVKKVPDKSKQEAAPGDHKDKKGKDSPNAEKTTQGEKEVVLKSSTLNPNAKEFSFNPTVKPFVPRTPPINNQQQAPNLQPAASPAAQIPVNYVTYPGPIHMSGHRVSFPSFMQQGVPIPQMTMANPSNMPQNSHPRYPGKPGKPHYVNNQGQRPDYSQQQQISNPALAATGHPVHLPAVPHGGVHQGYNHPGHGGNPGAPMYATGPMPAVYINQQVIRPGMGFYGNDGVPQYYLPMQVMPQGMMPQNNSHSATSTPQPQNQSTPMHGGPPTPTPVHHGNPNQQQNQQQPVIFAQHSNAGTPYAMPVFIPGHMQSAMSHHPNGNHQHSMPSSQAHQVPQGSMQGNGPLIPSSGMPNYQSQQGRV